jgi:hypothetical protein
MKVSLRVLWAAGVFCFLASSAMGSKLSPMISAPPLQISTLALPIGIANQPYSALLTGTGGTKPYAWSIVAGSLPPGLAMNNSGAISGTPCADAGTWWATFRVTDARLQSARRSLSIFICAGPLTITTTSLPKGTVGVPYSASLQATGGVARCP